MISGFNMGVRLTWVGTFSETAWPHQKNGNPLPVIIGLRGAVGPVIDVSLSVCTRQAVDF